jgi:very-short-patch-repair endonuclease/predicted transcriptional regulator of viral defense system
VARIDDQGVRSSSPRTDRALAELAARQHGVVSLAQLEAVGLGARGAQQRATRGRLHRIHLGVYAVGHAVLGADGRRMAAVLACGPEAVLSHRSAAAAWGLRPSDRARHEVSTPQRGRRSLPGIEVHGVRTLAHDDVTELRGIPMTTVARTLVDLAAVLPTPALERALREAEVLRVLDARAVLAAARNRRGTARLRRVLAEPDPGPTRSALEERFLALCRRRGLPPPRLNVLVGRLEVDALWPAERLIVELDGAAVHATRRAFDADRRRDAALVAAGYAVLRLTWLRVVYEADVVADEVRRALALRRAA